MIDQEKINIIITGKLKEITGCQVVKSNIANAPIPPYPYLSFTITGTETRKGTYGVAGGSRSIPLTQTWSFTAQSDKDNEAQMAALAAKDWLEDAGRNILADQGIVVQSVGAISNRDTLLTVEYEYRKGFDAVLSMMNVIKGRDKETIDYAEIKKE